jgi:rfaE bifunctional protein nucleotidyltransferase chain/domain
MSGLVLSVEQARALRAEAASQHKIVVLTNGCFDVLHVGHVRYLEEARQQGDLLLVGLNDDQSTRLVKGPGRPYVPQEDRAEILAALRCVDGVIFFSESTAEQLVKSLKPDVYVKGGNYRIDELPEARIVAEYGGRLYLTAHVPDRSTSSLVSTILARHTGESE